MVILLEEINKLYDKLDNHMHHHHHVHDHDESESTTSASLSAFRSDISTHLNQLDLNLKPAVGSERFISFPWIQKCFEILPTVHKSFANLVQDLEYPISKWEANSIDDYLKYTLTLLDLFNSISARLSDLRQARLVLSHALTVVHTSSCSAVIDHLKPIKKKSFDWDFNKDCRVDHIKGVENLGKESAIQEGFIIMKSIGLWVCGIVISCLHGDEKPYFEMRKPAKELRFDSLEGLDSSVCEVVKENNEGDFLKEVREVNEVVSRVSDVIVVDGRIGEDGGEMERRLEVFEKEMYGLGKEVDCVFSGVLNDRIQLLDSIRLKM